MRTVLLLPILILSSSCLSQNTSKAFGSHVYNDQVILVSQSGHFGAIKFTRQEHKPKEEAEFEYVFMTDGSSIIDPSSSSCVSGVATTDECVLKFGPFVFDWSVASDGHGYLYFETLHGKRSDPHQVKFYISSLNHLGKLIDASEKNIPYSVEPPEHDW